MEKLTTLLFVTFLPGAIFAQFSKVQPIPPTKDGLRENYSQNDFENFLLREKLGEIPFQGSIIDNTAAVDAQVNNNAGATGTGYFSQSEMSILAFGNSVIIGFNDSGSNSGGSNKFTGWSYSIDGGATFTDGGTLPTNGGGDAGDPVLARNETTGRIYITPAGASRWDMVLAGGEAWGPGDATYTFSYDGDLAAAGLVSVTRPPDGPPLTVFNWSPVEWDDPVEHHTLVAHFASVPAPRAGDLSLEDAAGAGLRTEPWVNERYLISYRGEGSPPTLWVRFHQADVPARGPHRVQLYLPSGHFPGVAVQAERRLAALRAQEESHRASTGSRPAS